jgi:hypothetical protein
VNNNELSPSIDIPRSSKGLEKASVALMASDKMEIMQTRTTTIADL